MPTLAAETLSEFMAFKASFWCHRGYVSGNPLSDSMTFNNAAFASLGVMTGTLRMGVGVSITE